MKILRIGDPHVTLLNMNDCEKLMDFSISIAKKNKISVIEILGDLFHTHAIKRIEVEDFWKRTFTKLEMEGIQVRVLVGNHDVPGSLEKEQLMNSLNVFNQEGDTNHLRTIINKPMIIDGIAYIPYMSNHNEFIEASRTLYQQGATKLLVAHQTFTGASYDNGFYAPDGIEPELVCQDEIISGHIHTTQQIGKCFYPGTPKWDSIVEANLSKGVWVFEHNDDMSVKAKAMINTSDIVTPIYRVVVNEGDEVPELNKNAHNYLEFHGKRDWISKMKKKYKGKARIKGIPTDKKTNAVVRPDGYSLDQYLIDTFEPVKSITKNEINEYLRGLNGR